MHPVGFVRDFAIRDNHTKKWSVITEFRRKSFKIRGCCQFLCFCDGAYRERGIADCVARNGGSEGVGNSGGQYWKAVLCLGIFKASTRTQLLTCDQQQSITVNPSPPPPAKTSGHRSSAFARARRRWQFVAEQGRNKSKQNTDCIIKSRQSRSRFNVDICEEVIFHSIFFEDGDHGDAPQFARQG